MFFTCFACKFFRIDKLLIRIPPLKDQRSFCKPPDFSALLQLFSDFPFFGPLSMFSDCTKLMNTDVLPHSSGGVLRWRHNNRNIMVQEYHGTSLSRSLSMCLEICVHARTRRSHTVPCQSVPMANQNTWKLTQWSQESDGSSSK